MITRSFFKLIKLLFIIILSQLISLILFYINFALYKIYIILYYFNYIVFYITLILILLYFNLNLIYYILFYIALILCCIILYSFTLNFSILLFQVN